MSDQKSPAAAKSEPASCSVLGPYRVHTNARIVEAGEEEERWQCSDCGVEWVTGCAEVMP